MDGERRDELIRLLRAASVFLAAAAALCSVCDGRQWRVAGRVVGAAGVIIATCADWLERSNLAVGRGRRGTG